jgi:hypothetical protein
LFEDELLTYAVSKNVSNRVSSDTDDAAENGTDWLAEIHASEGSLAISCTSTSSATVIGLRSIDCTS